MTDVRSASAADQERSIDEWMQSWSAHDLDGVLRLLTPDAVFEDVTMGAVNRSAAEVRAFGEGFLSGFPDVTFTATSRFANGTRGGSEWVMRGTHRGDLPEMPATGKQIEIRGVSMFEFAGDRIRRCSDYWDMATFLRQLGMMPSD
jgi:steroid delta-isomerase-like uncharacterized protein